MGYFPMSAGPSPEQLDQLQQEVDLLGQVLGKKAPRLTPAHFAIHCSQGTWFPFRHLLIIVRALVLVALGKIKRLVVSMPPQHGKSELISHWFVAWLLGNFPDRRVILCSYEAEFAAGWGEKVRNTLETWGGPVFGIKIDGRSSAKARWRIKGKRGGMDCVGIDGPANGKPADLVIVDDPIKTPEEAASPERRQKHKDWFTSVAEARLSKIGAAIVVMTRWHEDDLAGWLYAQSLLGIGEACTFIVMPALALDPEQLPEDARAYFGPDPLGREVDEPLCPDLHDKQKLVHLRNRNATLFWAVQQQYPHSPQGNIFVRDKFNRWSASNCPLELDPEHGFYRPRKGVEPFDRVIQSWDFTYGSLTGRSWCVGQVWGQRGSDYFLIFQTRGHWTFDQMCDEVVAVTDLFPMAAGKLIEAKASGPHVIRRLRKKISGLLPIPVYASKLARAFSVVPLVNAGNVWIPDENAFPWVAEFLREITAFPMALTDDQVDTLSQALAFLDGQPIFKTTKKKPKGFR